jgi:hypothetical protein
MTVQEQSGPGDVDSSRRTLLKVGIAGALAAGAVGARIADSAPAAARSGPRLNGPIFYDVETTHGVVRGIADVGIKSFRGIPYGADTGGKSRFMPPRPPSSWSGARNCIGYGPISPQTQSSFKDDYGQLIMWDRHVGCGGMGEDCLNLNVWTPGQTTTPSARYWCLFTAVVGPPARPTDRCTTAGNSRCSATWSWSR